ncbi:MAG: hypothetical protein H6587_02455 [Flavobacteriales bacterium]|nr:hypothetical protein [Flavobacteriales bacterium]
MTKVLFVFIMLSICISTKGQVVSSDTTNVDLKKLNETLRYTGSQIIKSQNQSITAILFYTVGAVFIIQGYNKDKSALKILGYSSYGVGGVFSISSFYARRKAYKKMRDL